jgi:hypothetical protein
MLVRLLKKGKKLHVVLDLNTGEVRVFNTSDYAKRLPLLELNRCDAYTRLNAESITVKRKLKQIQDRKESKQITELVKRTAAQNPEKYELQSNENLEELDMGETGSSSSSSGSL